MTTRHHPTGEFLTLAAPYFDLPAYCLSLPLSPLSQFRDRKCNPTVLGSCNVRSVRASAFLSLQSGSPSGVLLGSLLDSLSGVIERAVQNNEKYYEKHHGGVDNDDGDNNNRNDDDTANIGVKNIGSEGTKQPLIRQHTQELLVFSCIEQWVIQLLTAASQFLSSCTRRGAHQLVGEIKGAIKEFLLRHRATFFDDDRGEGDRMGGGGRLQTSGSRHGQIELVDFSRVRGVAQAAWSEMFPGEHVHPSGPVLTGEPNLSSVPALNLTAATATPHPDQAHTDSNRNVPVRSVESK